VRQIRSYFQQLFPLNPGGIIPSGPNEEDLGLREPHGREAMGGGEGVFYTREKGVRAAGERPLQAP
jgi:hypothetical protein